MGNVKNQMAVVGILTIAAVTVIITVVCNYKVYLQNSCSVEDDPRGVSVCLNMGENYNPRGLSPCPLATTVEIHIPKLPH